MIKLVTGYSKKVPGTEPYSSEGLYLSVEVELPESMLNDAERFKQSVRRLFAQARAEVEHQAQDVVQQQEGATVSGNGRNGGNGRGSSEPASPRQLDYLVSVAKRNGNVSPKELVRIAGVGQLTDLSKAQASALIDQYQNGNGR